MGTMAQRGLKRGKMRRVLAAGLLSVLAAAMPGLAIGQERPQLSLPLDCIPNKTCFIQNFVDLDPSPGVRDFSCGSASYDKHTGTDFRLLSVEAAKAGVTVKAAADGVVKAVRDGVADALIRETKGEDIKGRECGNGVLIEHGGGWETQYCHLKQGSLKVSAGDTVERGATLGEVGYSGMADFAHVHLTVRHSGKVIDPFLPDSVNGACARDLTSAGMWVPHEIARFPYRAGIIAHSGFAGALPDKDELEKNHAEVEPITPTAEALVFYGRMLNLSAGDRIRITINGPGGTLVEHLSEPLERSRALHLASLGKKRRDGRWMAGRYTGQIEIVREGAVTAAAVAEITMP